MKKPISGIYKIQSLIKPERIYIGSAVNIANRWRVHLYTFKKNMHQAKMQNHYNKYGESDLVFSILMECDIKDLITFEQSFMDLLNPYFNICKKADSCLGVKHSEKAKQNMSKSHIGLTYSEEHNQHTAKSLIGNKYCLGKHFNIGINNPMYGKSAWKNKKSL